MKHLLKRLFVLVAIPVLVFAQNNTTVSNSSIVANSTNTTVSKTSLRKKLHFHLTFNLDVSGNLPVKSVS